MAGKPLIGCKPCRSHHEIAGQSARHDRAALATRRAVQRWGFEIQCRNEAEYSSSLTAVRLPQRHSADALRRQILQDANLSLGNGLGPLADRVCPLTCARPAVSAGIASELSQTPSPNLNEELVATFFID